MHMKIVNISVQSVDAKVMAESAKILAEKEGLEIDVFCANSEHLDNDAMVYQSLLRATEDADMVVIRCMSDPARFMKFEKYEKVLKDHKGYVFLHSGNADVRLAYRNMFKGSDADFFTLSNYIGFRGAENEYGVMLWLNRALCGREIPLPEPVRQRTDGIYHPDMDRDITLHEYREHLRPDRPTVGLLFTANHWIYRNTDHIDALIRTLESMDLNVIPAFFSSQTSKADDSDGTIAYVKKYMMVRDVPAVDVLIMNSPFSQLVSSRETTGMTVCDDENFFKFLTDVPVIQAMMSSSRYVDFEEAAQGPGRSEMMMQVAWPEIDGQIISVPIGGASDTNRSVKKTVPLNGRIEHIARLAKNWAVLRRKAPSERKVAILMFQSRPDSGRIGNAAGLDVLESVYEILKRMDSEGYAIDNVPGSSRELLEEILNGLTNDLNWTPPHIVREKAADTVGLNDYMSEFNRLSEFNRGRMTKVWGEPPGEICTDGTDMMIPGLIKGNVFIGYQPIRGWADQMDSLYHDPNVPVQHQYLGYYRWIQNVFQADVVVHMGTHGTLEWLPGKGVGLSDKCEPDIVLNSMPHIYPYIIDDPGEGIQAKRRSEAVLIGHLNPILSRAGTYDELAEIEVPLQEYLKNRNMTEERRATLISQIYDAVKRRSMFNDLRITDDPGPEGFEAYLTKLHDYIAEIKDALIRNGLHVIGKVPNGERMDDAIYSLMRLRNGTVPSLRTSLADTMGIDIENAINDPSGSSGSGELNSSLIDKVDSELQNLLEDMRAVDHDPDRCMRLSEERWPGASEGFVGSLRYALEKVIPNIKRTKEELDNMLLGMDGRYVLPGPSGAPTRGNADVLPTGRNYYGLDPDSVPSKAAWATGKKMADQMICRYAEEKGEYPKEVGFIIWATDTMKTNGDDVAYILWLMGIRPIWSRTGGQVVDLEIVPLSELKRPRIDVSVRITGLFRDVFPNLIDLIDRAVEMASALDESDEDNILAANLRKDMIEGIAKGLDLEECRRRSSARIFGPPAGVYGAGVNHAIETGEWETVRDLADIYITWGSCAYGRGLHGVQMKDEFIRRFGSVGITVKNMPDREFDVFDVDDVYGYLGGLNAFVREYGNKDSMTVIGDNSDPDRLKIRDAAEECRYVFRSKILNPKFLEGLKEHGYRGVGELAKLTEYMIGWDATSDVLDDWMYEGVAEKLLLDDSTRQWMEDENPYALMEIINRLQEAADRGLWDADDNMRRKLKDLFMDAEERIEEITDR